MTPAERSLLDPDVLRDLFRQLESTDVDELEVSLGSARLYLRRDPGRRFVAAPGEHAAADGTATAAEGMSVRAPLAGVLYMRPSPEQPPFVAIGDPVEPGQVVALIETMKLFNEVTVDIAGEVISLPVAEGELVEAGQPLLFMRPRESGG
jgi:acetyl-CoA carboxylase biotin carboxyl carrier protein